MKKVKITNEDRFAAIFIHFQPTQSGGNPQESEHQRAMMGGLQRGLTQTPPGQKRNKEQDAYNAERDWLRNLCFCRWPTHADSSR